MSDNIIAPNVPNAITITIMGMVGALVVGMIRKALNGKGPAVAPRVGA